MDNTLTRRTALKQMAAAVGGGAFAMAAPAMGISQSRFPSPMPSTPSGNARHYRLSLGQLRLTIIGDGQAAFPAYPTYAPNATEAQVKQALRDSFSDETLYTLNCNILVVETASRVAVVDTGAGTYLGPDLGHLKHHLADAGIEPSRVTDVLLTHAHLDHIGGLVDAEGKLLFPNAVVHLHEWEWTYWRNQATDLRELNIPAEFKQGFLAAARTGLAAVADRVQPFRQSGEILPGIQAEPAPGHTGGHTLFRIYDGAQSLLHMADVFHHPQFDLAHLDWQTAFDHDPQQAYQTRKRALNMAATDRSLVMAYHMPFPALGFLRSKGNHYEWSQVPWMFQPA